MVGLVEQLRKSNFLKQNAILFCGSLAVSILNYLYYPILARLLRLEEFGEVQVLISLFLQLTIFLSVLTQITVNIVANYKNEVQRNRVVFELEKLAFFLSIIILIAGSVFSAQLQQVFNFHSPVSFIILLIAVSVTVPMTFRIAYLRGQQSFSAVSLAQIIGSFGKIVAAVLLVIIGFSTAGAIGGLLVAQVLALLYAGYRARRLGFVKPTGVSYFNWPKLQILMPEVKYITFVFAASLGVVVLSSIDVLLVKAFFDAETAGGYAGIATVAKVIFFLTASIGQVMLPAVRMEQPKNKNRRFLIKSFGLLAGLGGVALAVFALLPGLVIAVLMGKNFVDYAYLLPLLSLSMFFISIINLIVSYYIALRRYQVGFIVIAGVVLTIALLTVRHASLSDVAWQLVYGTGLMIVMFVAWRSVYELSKRRSYGRG